MHKNIFEPKVGNSDDRKDQIWLLSRLNDETLFENNPQKDAKEQTVPGWSPFNMQISDKEPMKTSIGYCPIISDSPTDYKTVYDVMTTMLTMTNKLGQEKAVLTLDLAIYSKAKILQWNYPQVFKNLILRLCGVHLCLNFIGAIGKLYKCSGLEECIIEPMGQTSMDLIHWPISWLANSIIEESGCVRSCFEGCFREEMGSIHSMGERK